MIEEVFKICKQIDDLRGSYDVLASLTSEVGELATEVGIDEGHLLKEPSEDGIIGESVDVIVAALDMIWINNPNITIEEVESLILKKSQKWLNIKAASPNTRF